MIERRGSEMTHQQRVRGPLWVMCGYWTCCWPVASTSTACVRARGEQFKHML